MKDIYKKTPPMAEYARSSPSPLCERKSNISYIRRGVDLTILGLLFSLSLHRILNMNQNNNVWLVAFFCESSFSFLWLILTCLKWSPAENIPYPIRLDERVHDLPSVDMFVTTVDALREPPIIVVNTVLSLLSVNYPANKLACYVSDDGCSPLTYFSLKEASKFAKIWVPFCKKYKVIVRAPFRYFLSPLAATEGYAFRKDWKMMKREYEKLSRTVKYATQDSHWLDADDDFEAFSNTKPNDHSSIVKVVWDNKGGVGDEKEVPHLVYISREKRPNYFHHYKAGAMNFLVRVSGLMTNAPYILSMDCDMHANDADVVRQAMCIFLQTSRNPNHCAFVQFCLEFHDSNAVEYTVMLKQMERGLAGIQGPICSGTGCFHARRVMYGLPPDDCEDNGSLSSVATRDLLSDEDSLLRRFGNSKEMVKSVVEALQNMSNPRNTITNSIETAQKVGHYHYEYQTNWGKTIGWLYDSVAEDLNTSYGIHSRGWTSSFLSPDPPAFIGYAPSGGVEAMVQRRRWATGAMELLFNNQNPLLGLFSQKIRFRQRLAYFSVFFCIRSIPELLYCLLPAYCILHNSVLFPKGPCLVITAILVGMHCLYTLWEFMSGCYSVESWYVSQSFGRIIATSSWLFSIFDIIFKLLGISKTVFIITKKTIDETSARSAGTAPSQRKDGGPNTNTSKTEFDISLYFLPGTSIILVNLAAIAYFLVGLQWSSYSHGGCGSGLALACGCILVVILFFPFLKGLFKKGNYGIPLSTLSKAAFLTILFVVFSVWN